jgi:hypothetical protein
MKNYKYSASIIELSKLLRRRKDFKLKLPGSNSLFGPVYDVSMFLEGEFIAFEADQISNEYFFIGQIKKTGMDKTGKRWYDVKCILRPAVHDPVRKINWLPKARILRKSIICEIRAIRYENRN